MPLMDVKMTKGEVATFLREKGIPLNFSKLFEGKYQTTTCTGRLIVATVNYGFYPENFIDGCAFVMLTQKDVRKLVPPIGLAKKIISLIPKVSKVHVPTCALSLMI